MYYNHLIGSKFENSLEQLQRDKQQQSKSAMSTNSRDERRGSSAAYELFPAQAAHLSTVCGFRRSNFYFTIYVIFYIVFLVVASVIFMTLERPFEEETKVDILELKRKFIDDNKCLKDSDDLDEFINEVINAYKRGVIATGNTSVEPNWSFGQSFFFTATVVTTIGYGHVTPMTEGGKLFCIILAAFGIPLTLLLLSGCVSRWKIISDCFLNFLNSRFGHMCKPFNIQIFHLAFICFFVLIFFFIIPSVIFASLEPGWDFLDSLYYCVISLTTIGLGDYVPGDDQTQPYRLIYKLCTTGYLIVGLTFIMLALTVFYDVRELDFGTFFVLKSDGETSDPERMCLRKGGSEDGGHKYTPQFDDQGKNKYLNEEKNYSGIP